jgi:transcriptional regulator with XRE-family HTH domain
MSTSPTTDPQTLKIIARLRKEAGLSQAQVASAISVDSTRISKIENGVYSPSREEMLDILHAIASKDAADLASFLSNEWVILDCPDFDHPNRESLWQAELALQTLENLRRRSISSLVSARLDLMYNNIRRHADHLRRTDYRIVFIGEIGVGKTTLLCVLTGLVLGDGISDGEIVLETGPGRTTLCDVQIEHGPQVGLIIEPYSSDDVLGLARDFCEGIWSRKTDERPDATKGVSQEMERAIRNMSGLTRPRRAKGKDSDQGPQPDPALSLATDCGSLDAFVSGVWLRLDLPRRVKRKLECPKSDGEPFRWLASQYRDINNGRNSEVSLPRTVRVVIPRPPLELGPFEVEVVDTKGIDSNMSRSDLREHRDDERTLIVICSGFKDAPSAAGQAFMRHGVEEGARSAILERGTVLVLPKYHEASEMKDDDGYQVESVQGGYGLRREQIEVELGKIDISGIPVEFVNATRPDDAQHAVAAFQRRLEDVVAFHRGAIEKLKEAAMEAEQNHEQQADEAAHARVRELLRGFIKRRGPLSKRRKPVEHRLIAGLQTSAPQTVWATARRNGLWGNLYAPTEIGAGAVVDAQLRTREAFDGLREIISSMLQVEDLKPAHQYLQTLLDSTPIWQQTFLQQVRSAGTLTYHEKLKNALEMWDSCSDRYGRGKGFRNEVAAEVQSWFRDSDQEDLAVLLDQRIATAWHECVIAPLKAVVGKSTD